MWKRDVKFIFASFHTIEYNHGNGIKKDQYIGQPWIFVIFITLQSHVLLCAYNQNSVILEKYKILYTYIMNAILNVSK